MFFGKYWTSWNFGVQSPHMKKKQVLLWLDCIGSPRHPEIWRTRPSRNSWRFSSSSSGGSRPLRLGRKWQLAFFLMNLGVCPVSLNFIHKHLQLLDRKAYNATTCLIFHGGNVQGMATMDDYSDKDPISHAERALIKTGPLECFFSSERGLSRLQPLKCLYVYKLICVCAWWCVCWKICPYIHIYIYK